MSREKDMHAEVVTALDIHLAELQCLRRRLTDPRTIELGERLDVVLQIAASAERLTHAVDTHHPAPAITRPVPHAQPDSATATIPLPPVHNAAGPGRDTPSTSTTHSKALA